MLNLMEKFDKGERDILNVHRFVEVLRFGFAARCEGLCSSRSSVS